MNSLNRRDFIKTSALAAGGLALGLSAKSYGRVLGANDRINVVFMGCGRRVPAYYGNIGDSHNTHLSYVCDVKESQRNRVLRDMSRRLSYKPESIEDIRIALDDDEVDAVFVATPDHWHAPGAWMSMEAGKHVYVEKPMTHNPAESEVLVRAQKKYNRVLQLGNQQRSSVHTKKIIDEIHNGVIGRPYKAVAFYSNQRGKVANQTRQAPPEDLNWDLFQGPAPRRPYTDDTWNYNWHWYGWDYGTAESGNNGLHELDVARWALQADYPEKVTAEAYKNHYPDDGWEVYDTMYATYYFPDNRVINWDGKSRNGFNTYDGGRGTIIYGTEGSVWVNRSLYKLFDRSGNLMRAEASGGSESGMALGGGGGMSTTHVANFFEAIRGQEDPSSPVEEGAKSTLLCHLANISYRSDSHLKLNPSNGKILDNPAANKFWSREYEPGWEPNI